MKTTTNLLFPFPVIRVCGIEADFNELEQICYSVRKHDPGRNVSNKMGWQSNNYASFPPHMNALQTAISSGIAEALSYRIFERCDVSINNWWINISGKNAYNERHMHPKSDFSGVFYIKCDPEKSGNIVFGAGDLRTDMDLYSHAIKDECKLYPNWWFPPERGSLILFPSGLRHGVDPNISEEDRISVAFNLQFNT